MLRLLQTVFRRGDRLSRLGRRGDAGAFARELAVADVWVFAALQSDGLDPATMTEQQVLAEIERAARDLGERDGFEPFVYETDGVQRLPFFSDQPHAESFIGEYSRERNRVFPFQLLSVKGAVLADLLSASDTFVLNDRSPDAYTLSPADRDALRQLRP